MAKLIPYRESYEEADAAQDYADVTMYGKAGIGRKYYYFKKGLKTFYLPLTEIKSAHRNIEMVTANACTAGENLFIQRMCVLTNSGEEIVSDTQDRKQAEKLFGLMRDAGIAMETPTKNKL